MFASKGHGLLEDLLFCIALGHGSLNQLLDRLHNFQTNFDRLFQLWLRVNLVGELIIQKEQR